MNEALKIQPKNKELIQLWKDEIGDLASIADFMPKTTYDIIACITYWKDKLTDAVPTWSLSQIKDQILKLEKLMMAGTDLAVDFLNQVQTVELKNAPKTIIGPEPDRSKLPTLIQVRTEIGKIFKEEGREAAIGYARLILIPGHYKEGTVFLESGIEGVVDNIIKETSQPIISLPVADIKKESKPKPAIDPWVALKKRFPSLSENITNEECMLIDTYEKILMKDENIRQAEENRIFDLVNQKWLKLDKSERKKITEKSTEEYNKLPSEDKAILTKEQFAISFYGKSLKYAPLAPLFDFCKTKSTIEKEAEAMKMIQTKVTILLEEHKENEARAITKLFFGNFDQQGLVIHRGRAWSDAETNFWLDWVKNGTPEKEWHLYQIKVKEQDRKLDEKVADIKKKRNKILNNVLEIPEQLKSDLTEIIELGLAHNDGHKKIFDRARQVYVEHKHKMHTGEWRTLYTHIKSEFENKNRKEEEKVEEPAKVFVRSDLKNTNPALWTRAKDITTLSALYTFLQDKTIDWINGLNLTYNLIFNDKIPLAKNWRDVDVEDWFDKYIQQGEEYIEPSEEVKSTVKIATETIEVDEILRLEKSESKSLPITLGDDLKALEKNLSKPNLSKSILKLFVKYGPSQKIKVQIKKTLQKMEGYAKQFENVKDNIIFAYMLGIQKWAEKKGELKPG